MGSHVFISYAHTDLATARRIHGALVRARIPVYIDLVGLGHGDSLTAKLGAAIESAGAVIPIVSRSSIDSDWVNRELVTCRESGIPLIPFKADDAFWPARLRLVLGDVLYIDGVDAPYAEGLVPKALVNMLSPGERAGAGHFFSLGSASGDAPYVQCFYGTVQTAWDELSFGRTAIVLPTDQSVYLGGRATTSILDHLGVHADSLTSERARIESREVSVLRRGNGDTGAPLLVASTVFNSREQPCAEDQWRSAGAVLRCAEEQRCSVVLVPPLGTGSFDWPVRQAIVNWLYGAVMWCRTNPTVTARSVWPVLCVPGPGDQKIMSYYLSELSRQRFEVMRDRKLTMRVRYKGTTSDELYVHHDVLLGSIARSAFSSLKSLRIRYRHGAGLRSRRSGLAFDYDSDTPLAKTIFADGDIIEAYVPS